MHKRLLSLLLSALIAVVPFSVSAMELFYDGEVHNYDTDPINLVINGKKTELSVMPPIILNDRTLVPAREVFESLGAKVTWLGELNRVTIDYKGTGIILTIGSRVVQIGMDRVVSISEGDPAPMIINDKTMIPVRFAAQALGFSVGWDDATRTVSISEPGYRKETKAPDTTSQGQNTDTTRPVTAKHTVSSVTMQSDAIYDYVYVTISDPVSPTVLRLHDSERVAIDFEDSGLSVPNGSTGTPGHVVSDVRYANNDNRVRVVLDVASQPLIAFFEWEKGVVIRAQKSDITFPVYDGIARKIYFDANYGLVSETSANNIYNIRLKTTTLGSGEIKIGDDYIEKIVVSKNALNTDISVIAYEDTAFKFSTNKSTINFGPKAGSDGKTAITTLPDNTLAADGDIRYSLNDKVKNKLVVIDAGHGGKDIGASFKLADGTYDIVEAKINLDIALRVEKYLTREGVGVVMTRSDDTYITLADRAEISNTSGAALFVSIHCNAMENQSDVDGTMVMYDQNADYSDSPINGYSLASEIKKGILANINFSDKGVREGGTLYVIKNNVLPAVLVECAFVSNEGDRAKLNSEAGRDAIARGIVDGIIKTLNSTVK